MVGRKRSRLTVISRPTPVAPMTTPPPEPEVIEGNFPPECIPGDDATFDDIEECRVMRKRFPNGEDIEELVEDFNMRSVYPFNRMPNPSKKSLLYYLEAGYLRDGRIVVLPSPGTAHDCNAFRALMEEWKNKPIHPITKWINEGLPSFQRFLKRVANPSFKDFLRMYPQGLDDRCTKTRCEWLTKLVQLMNYNLLGGFLKDEYEVVAKEDDPVQNPNARHILVDISALTTEKQMLVYAVKLVSQLFVTKITGQNISLEGNRMIFSVMHLLSQWMGCRDSVEFVGNVPTPKHVEYCTHCENITEIYNIENHWDEYYSNYADRGYFAWCKFCPNQATVYCRNVEFPKYYSPSTMEYHVVKEMSFAPAHIERRKEYEVDLEDPMIPYGNKSQILLRSCRGLKYSLIKPYLHASFNYFDAPH